MTKTLNYDLSDIKIESLNQANELLSTVQSKLSEISEEQTKLVIKKRELADEKSAELTTETTFAAIKKAASALFKTKQTTEELDIEIELLQELKQTCSAELLIEAGKLTRKILTEMEEYVAPFEKVMSLSNAEQTDLIYFELNQLYSDYITHYNAVLEESGWHIMYARTQPEYKGQEIKPIKINASHLFTQKGMLLIEAMKGI